MRSLLKANYSAHDKEQLNIFDFPLIKSVNSKQTLT